MQSGNTELTYKLLAGGKSRKKALGHIATTMAQHKTLADAASTLGVSLRTLQRWIKTYPALARTRNIAADSDAVQRLRSDDMHVAVVVQRVTGSYDD